MRKLLLGMVVMSVVVLHAAAAVGQEREVERADRDRPDRERPDGERRENLERERAVQERRELRERDEMRMQEEMRRREPGPAFEREEMPLPEMEIREFLKANLPHGLRALDMARAEGPRAYRERVIAFSEQIRGYRKMQEIAPDIAEAVMRSHKIEYECEMLAERIAETDNADRQEEAIAKLRGMLTEVFDLRLKEPEVQIKQMEREIKEVRQMIERRRESREKIVERHLREMLGREDNELGWW